MGDYPKKNEDNYLARHLPMFGTFSAPTSLIFCIQLRACMCVRKCDASNRTLYEYYRISSANRIEMPNIRKTTTTTSTTSKWNVYVYKKVPHPDRRRRVWVSPMYWIAAKKNCYWQGSRKIEKRGKVIIIAIANTATIHTAIRFTSLCTAFVLCGIIISHHHFIRPHICVNLFWVRGVDACRRWHYTFFFCLPSSTIQIKW